METKQLLTFCVLAATLLHLRAANPNDSVSREGVTVETGGAPAALSGQPFAPTSESFKQYECPEWFRDAKFGIWSHWGPDSVPGIFNNYARDMWRQGSAEYQWHLQHYGHPSKAGYEAVIESWKAEKFDPDVLVAKFKAAGAKYIAAVATHHDNFDCWNSTFHEWNSVKHGPHKDIVGLWRDATLKADLRFGLSSHADARGWNYMYGAQLADGNGPLAGVPYQGRNPNLESLYNSPKDARDNHPSQEWLQGWEQRHEELLKKYTPDFLFLDGGIPHGQLGMRVVADYLNQNFQDHHGVEEAVVTTGSLLPYKERGIMTNIQTKPWLCVSSLAGWFYMTHHSRNDPASDCKDTPTVIHMLADVVSKNGNLLMNFPQRGDGSLYPECAQVLDEFARWMPINGEAIFNTHPWTTFGEGPTVIAAKGMNELRVPLTWKDVRYTQSKDGTCLYTIACGIPQGELTLTAPAAVAERITSISLLGSDQPVFWKARPAGIVVHISASWPCQYAVTYKMTMKPATAK